jgi:hypothetical protein
MTDAPPPLVPAEVDLRDYAFTPLFRARLFGSSFHARATDSEWRAGVTLWLKSWDQVPAGTLPDDEIDLCRLAELGRDIKTWRKIAKGALHGWVKCSDDRLHHPVVAEGVLGAWETRTKQSRRGSAGAREKWRKHREAMAQAAPANGISKSSTMALAAGSDGACNAQAMLSDGKGREGKGQGREKKDSEPNGSDGEPSLDADVELYRRGKAVLGKNSGGQITKLRKAVGNERALEIIDQAKTKENKGEWIAGVIRNHASNELDTDALYKSWGVEI